MDSAACPFLTGRNIERYTCPPSEQLAEWQARVVWQQEPSFWVMLRIPRNMRVLVYGDSFMRQVGLSLLCANAPSVTDLALWGDVVAQEHRGDRGLHFDRLPDQLARARDAAGQAATGYSLWQALPEIAQEVFLTQGTFVFGTVNASLTFVINHPLFQRSPDASLNLMRALSVYSMTHVAFNLPHPACFFDRIAKCNATGHNCTRQYCVDHTGLPMGPTNSSLYDRFDPAVVFTDAQLTQAKLESWREGASVKPETIDSYSLIKRHGGFCNIPTSTRDLFCAASEPAGHQCMARAATTAYGPPTLLAWALMSRLTPAHTHPPKPWYNLAPL